MNKIEKYNIKYICNNDSLSEERINMAFDMLFEEIERVNVPKVQINNYVLQSDTKGHTMNIWTNS